MTRDEEPNLTSSLAIIGMGCRFPKAKNPEEFWNNLCGGVESISFFSDAELLANGLDPDHLSNPNYVKARAVLDDIELFDASFFGFTPREAELTDPQQRLFLEVAWQALEDAGYDAKRYQGVIGVYAGVGASSYLMDNLYRDSDQTALENAVQASLGNEKDFFATRVSYKLDLHGPSMNIQTACSTSLVAVHVACQSLLNFECDMALAGGATVRAIQKSGYLYTEGGILSPDGHCRAFDERAQGTVDGSGVGVIVLKRLEDAMADGDHIYALIRGSAINNDGSSKTGFTAPSVNGQAEVIVEAQSVAKVEAETIGYIETHGTATPLGDTIEIAALSQAFRAGVARKGFCAIGSVKTNIGHLDAAAGVAGLIKTVLALKHQMIPPSLHFESPNRQINFAESPFYVNTKLSPWKANGTPLRAGVSSFGIGGTNAHVIVEQAPQTDRSSDSRPWQLLPLSARTSSALETMTANLAGHLKRSGYLNFADIAYTLQLGRKPFEYRRIIVSHDSDDAVRAIESRDASSVFSGAYDGESRSVVFMFPGQGAQYVNMGLELYRTEPTFRDQVDHCSVTLTPFLGFDLRRLLFPKDQDDLESGRRLGETYITQPAIFVIEYALASLWTKWGLRPQVMIGHSLGEYVAACLAGVFSVEDALRLVALRGRLMQNLPTGAMLAVSLSEEELKPELTGGLSLAAVNAPDLCVISGPVDEISELSNRLNERGVASKRLETSHAFHSNMMDPILDSFAQELNRVPLHPPAIPYVSNLTGTWITAEEATSLDYWVKHLRRPVRFSQGLGLLLEERGRVFLEIGPGQTLGGLIKRRLKSSAQPVVVSSLRRRQSRDSDLQFLLKSLGQLWLAGAEIDWLAAHEGQRRRRAPLPTYPFEYERYWIEPRSRKSAGPSIERASEIADWFYTTSWKRLALTDLANAPGVDGAKMRWTVFVDRRGLGEILVKNLRQAGHEVVAVVAGERFNQLPEDTFEIRPRERNDYDLLVRELQGLNKIPNKICHLWNVSDKIEPQSLTSQEVIALAFYSPLFLCQALGQQIPTLPVQITFVSNDMQEVMGGEVSCPEKAMLLGPCRVIAQEFPAFECRSVDLTFSGQAESQDERLVDRLIVEMMAETPDRVIAYRGHHRWVQTIENARLRPSSGMPGRLKSGGVYLITGGCGGIGLTLAEFLARTVQGKLILIGRTQFPERGQWTSWLETRGGEDNLSRIIRKLLALEEMGAEVLVLRADVSDVGQMREAITQARQRFGRIHGVINAAGLAGSGIIHRQTPETAEKVLAPKVAGTRILESLFDGHELDFLILISSLNSITGGVGQVDYCAANSFLDAFAFYHNARHGAFTVSINWGAWQEVGMAADAIRSFASRRDQLPLPLKSAGHPLLDVSRTESPDRIIFSTELSVSRHWILDEHRLMGQALVPGTAYLEMVRAAVEPQTDGRMLEIRDALFLTPLWVDERNKMAEIVIEKSLNGHSFVIKSQSESEPAGDAKWTDHVMGRVEYRSEVQPSRYDIQSLIKKCNVRTIVMEDGERGEGLGPRWAAIKRIYVGNKERLALVELPEDFLPDLEDYKLHPSLLDLATGFAKQFEPGFYLPLSYKRLTLLHPLTNRLYSYARQRESNYPTKETLEYDIVIMDEVGTELVEIEEFTVKLAVEPSVKIKSADERDALGTNRDAAIYQTERSAPMGAAHSTAPDLLSGAILPKEGAEAFGRILSGISLSQVLVSPFDVRTMMERPGALDVLFSSEKITGSLHPRPRLGTALEPPATELERAIARVWQGALGVDEIGRHDNFFELGGDSVLAIQIMAKLNKSGLRLTVQQLFQYQTVAELAEIAQGPEEVRAGRVTNSGPLPLMPGQQKFVESHGDELNRLCHVILIETSKDFNPSWLEKSLEHLLTYHDALSLRFEYSESNWLQLDSGHSRHIPFELIDLSAVSEVEQESAIEKKIAGLKVGMNLSEGPLIQTAWFDLGRERAARFLMIIHCLICDARSISVILEDLQSAYWRLSKGEPPRPGPRQSSFKNWVEKLYEYAQTSESRQKLSPWISELPPYTHRLPIDAEQRPQIRSEPRILRLSLEAEETQALTGEILTASKIQVNDILLTALVRAFTQWTGEPSLLIDQSEPGRASIFEGIDVSRTVGCFNHIFPARFEIAPDAGLSDCLVAIKEQRRRIPNEGIDYGLQLYLSKDSTAVGKLKELPRPEVCFNYFGPVARPQSGSPIFGPASKLELRSPCRIGLGDYLIAINAFLPEDCLQVEWIYNRSLVEEFRVERLAANFKRELVALIKHCQAPGEGAHIPSDFPLANLDKQKLIKLSQLISKYDS
jgi:non-ribosomal peptide synthase protein (TIGR01720 family)